MKASDDKKPAWNRAKVCIGIAGCNLSAVKHPYPEIHENPPKSIEIHGNRTNLLKSIENDESPQMTRSQPGIEQRFL